MKKKETHYDEPVVRYSDYLRVAKYARYIRKELVTKIFLGLAVTGTYILQAVVLSQGVSGVFAGESFANVCIWFAVAAGCILLRAILVRQNEGYTKEIGGKVKTLLRELIIGKLMLLGPGYQADKRSGRFQALVTDGVEYLEPYLVSYIPQIFVVAFSVIPIVCYVFFYSKAAGLIILLAVILAIAMPHIMMPFYTKACIGYWRDYAVLSAHYIDTMQGMNTLKVFNAEKTKGQELYEASERFRIRQTTNTKYSLISTANVALMTGIATSFTSGMAAYQAAGGQIPSAQLLIIMFLAIECVRPIGDLNNAWHSCMMGFSVSSEILEILDEPLKIQEADDPDSQCMEEGLPHIQIDDVSFRYHETREQAIDHLSMDILPGETVAIVGSSGSGKSTIVNLLLRFYDAQSGHITINGTDIRNISLEYLRNRISVVFQTTYLFYGTIRDNLRMANPEASDEEIIDAAKAANAHEFIMATANGYDTFVGERGDTLSGGQKQRIAIARAILKKAPVLIMDEATSSVDAASEKKIQETTEALQGRFTTIIIAHRLSTIRNAHKIIVLDKGTIAECGTHEELMKKNGLYYRLVQAQDGGSDE